MKRAARDRRPYPSFADLLDRDSHVLGGYRYLFMVRRPFMAADCALKTGQRVICVRCRRILLQVSFCRIRTDARSRLRRSLDSAARAPFAQKVGSGRIQLVRNGLDHPESRVRTGALDQGNRSLVGTHRSAEFALTELVLRPQATDIGGERFGCREVAGRKTARERCVRRLLLLFRRGCLARHLQGFAFMSWEDDRVCQRSVFSTSTVVREGRKLSGGILSTVQELIQGIVSAAIRSRAGSDEFGNTKNVAPR